MICVKEIKTSWKDLRNNRNINPRSICPTKSKNLFYFIQRYDVLITTLKLQSQNKVGLSIEQISNYICILINNYNRDSKLPFNYYYELVSGPKNTKMHSIPFNYFSFEKMLPVKYREERVWYGNKPVLLRTFFWRNCLFCLSQSIV